MDMVIQMFICSYVNWCSSCSNVQIETAVNVSTVDWSGCTAGIQYNMTVTNSDFVVLYRNSTSRCSGNLTIHYSLGKGTTHALTVTNYSFLNNLWATGAVSKSQSMTNRENSVRNVTNTCNSYSKITMAIIVLSCVTIVILVFFVIDSLKNYLLKH